jgi:two-component system, NtrC family, response regulator HydG
MDDRDHAYADDLATVPHPSSPEPLAAPASYVLTVIEGPDQGRTFTLGSAEPSRVLLGQSPACDARLTDRQVSRRHAALEPVGQRLRLTDLGSSNGTFVDGIGIVEVYLRGGEIVRMGGTALRVDRGAPTPAPATSSASGFGRVIGASPVMRRLYPLCERIAASTLPVVIEGETGTGKELLAEALHETGPRAQGPYVVFDCTAVPANLVESELFGHERGAFTGAVASRKGVFELAHGGTLLIDEIGDLEIALQAKLLRALERSEIRRVGSAQPLRVDARVIAATRRDLDHEVQAGRFRDDLFHRLAIARVELPPLRRRHGDIALLAAHFWREMGAREPLDTELLKRFEDYAWPGNVRELRNTLARRIELGDFDVAGAGLADSAGGAGVRSLEIDEILALDLPFVPARARVVEDFERRYVERALTRHGGNVSKAAAASGLARRSFQIIRARQSK